MRELKFNVKGQTLEKDPNCDFDGLIMGSNNYICLVFNFSDEWKEARRAIEFTAGNMNKFYEIDSAVILPEEITVKPYFKITLHAVSGDTQFKTNSVLIRQERG